MSVPPVTSSNPSAVSAPTDQSTSDPRIAKLMELLTAYRKIVVQHNRAVVRYDALVDAQDLHPIMADFFPQFSEAAEPIEELLATQAELKKRVFAAHKLVTKYMKANHVTRGEYNRCNKAVKEQHPDPIRKFF